MMKGNGQALHHEGRTKLWPRIRNVPPEIVQRVTAVILPQLIDIKKIYECSDGYPISLVEGGFPVSILTLLRRPADGEPDPRVAEWEKLLADLKNRGANLDWQSIFGGWHRDLRNDEHVDLFEVYERLNRHRIHLGVMRKNRKKLMALRRRYQNDPILRAANPEMHIITVIDDLLLRYGRDSILPLSLDGISVSQEKDPSRQAFWMPPIRVMVNELRPHLRSDNETYQTVAKVLNLAFPAFPDNWRLVKQRYLRDMRRLSEDLHVSVADLREHLMKFGYLRKVKVEAAEDREFHHP